MSRTKPHSTHCTHHPVLLRHQAVYLISLLIKHAQQIQFDITRHNINDWNRVTDEFNARFEGKPCTTGSGEAQMKKTVAMLYCALMENEEEYKRLFAEAEQAFRAEKRRAEKARVG